MKNIRLPFLSFLAVLLIAMSSSPLFAGGAKFNYSGEVTIECYGASGTTTYTQYISVFYYSQDNVLGIYDLVSDFPPFPASVDLDTDSFTFNYDYNGTNVSGFGAMNDEGNVNVYWVVTRNGQTTSYSTQYRPNTMPTATTDLSEGERLEIGPNPMTTHATIRTHLKNNRDVSIGIYDLQGKMVREYSDPGATLWMERGNLNAGTYIYRLIRKGEVLDTGRLLIQ